MSQKKVPQKTEKVLRAVIAYLEQEPRRLEMGQWGIIIPNNVDEIEGIDHSSQPAPPCGTAACVAGTCLLVTKAGKDFLKDNGAVKTRGLTDYIQFPGDTPEKAAQILGLSEERASSLFYFKGWSGMGGWPKKFSQRYKKAVTPRGRFLATRDRLEHFIATGE